MTDSISVSGQRLDQWLWFARVVRSRTLAAQLVGAGRIRANRVRVLKPSHLLRPGDVLTIAMRGGEVRILKVLALSERRGPPREAQLLYRRIGGTDAADPA